MSSTTTRARAAMVREAAGIVAQYQGLGGMSDETALGTMLVSGIDLGIGLALARPEIAREVMAGWDAVDHVVVRQFVDGIGEAVR